MLIIALMLCMATPAPPQTPGGLFEGQSDIGAVAHPGVVHYDEGKRSYLIAASGENMWTTFDEFHFVWKKVLPGDASITAAITILTAQGNNHRKGVLMMRQSLDSDSAYVSAALHGDGLASIQSRPGERRQHLRSAIESRANPKRCGWSSMVTTHTCSRAVHDRI